MSTILWQYEKRIYSERITKILLTGLLSHCTCKVCLAESAKQVPAYYSYKIGASEYYSYFRPAYVVEGIFYHSYYRGCPKESGTIVIGGLEDFFSSLDELDQSIIIFNLDLFSGS